MSVTNENRVNGPFTGTATVLPFDFKVFDESEVVVIRTSVLGIESTLALTTDYTVTLNPDQDVAPGGDVTLVVAPTGGGMKTTVTSELEYTQPVVLANLGPFFGKVHEKEFDRLTILIQQVKELVGRALRFPISDGGTVADLQGSSFRANKALVFDSSGNPTVSDIDINTLTLADGAVSTVKLADGAVTSVKIANGNVTNEKLASTIGTGAVALASSLGRDAGVIQINTTATVTPAQVNNLIVLGASGGVTITLPLTSATNVGDKVSFIAQGGAFTLSRQGGTDVFFNPQTQSTATSITIQGSDNVTLENYGANVWYVVSGSRFGFGNNQVWTNVDASRAVGVTYTNTTGKPIQVSASYVLTTSNALELVIGGVSAALVSPDSATGVYLTLSGVVPPGGTYIIRYVSGSASTQVHWSELR